MAIGQAGAANAKPTVVVVRLYPDEFVNNLKITFNEAVVGIRSGHNENI